MLKIALVLVLSSMACWGQAPKEASSGAEKTEKTEKVDNATAYYHYMVAHLYAEMAVNSGDRNSEYEEKAAESLKAALKADPQAPARIPVAPFSYRRGPIARPPAARP